jgi:glycerol kinase
MVLKVERIWIPVQVSHVEYRAEITVSRPNVPARTILGLAIFANYVAGCSEETQELRNIEMSVNRQRRRFEVESRVASERADIN